MVGKITKPKYKDLTFLVPESSRIGTTPKIMIFVNDMVTKRLNSPI